jgi:hypothetical protein
MPGRIDVGAGVVHHGDEHRRQPVHIAGLSKGFFVRLPDAVHDGRMARIARGAVIELPAQVDDLHAEASCCEMLCPPECVMTFLRNVISLCLFDLSVIFSENRYPLFRIML